MKRRRLSPVWWTRILVSALVLVACVVVFTSNRLLTERFTDRTRGAAEVRLALYSANLLSELQRNSIVPQLLARDPSLIGALNSADYTQSTSRLLSFVDEIGAASLLLMDTDGRIVAATNRERLGENQWSQRSFLDALRTNVTTFTVGEREEGGYSFTYSRRIDDGGQVIGVVSVEVDLAKWERSWAGISDAVMVLDSEGIAILATEPRWRGRLEEEGIALQEPQTAIERALRGTPDWSALPIDAYLRGDGVMRQEARVSFQGWRVVSFTTFQSVRERVNAILALEIMGFAITLAGLFWFLSRKSNLAARMFQMESAELRQLNSRLQREIAERKKVEKDLEVAEQTVAQTSKLAALGEMSAAVSHELNQPLAAMKTYLAGVRLLISRERPDEAVVAVQRIDSLIERMGAITKQLKSYARKGKDSLEPVDMKDAVLSSLSMMEPQLRQRQVAITRTLPDQPVMIFGDRMRLEQVIINLLRNALDATKMAGEPVIEILLVQGDVARLSVHDNGGGIEDLDELFEPFYTTKAPGDGTGLGLAISSGIVNDFGGRLTARNSAKGGAVFEVELPILGSEIEAAE
ncbi:two-component system, NtrC family, C4-dicarboxylate transport sensor histidine kinase DctB [Octadecabacter temperatus]|uniref:C4-dicarboxylate transport sensor protein DctB n=1 Tax=Octadecabacter temperatus TaxID=1458307 RepID=A0A0K0Y5W5_9RHOB|nr:ATP-binding protein [Octadecabacter temperatus]AKS46315.1 C4-dicarboxylate transport sensor protein DctB [Octadecabacter temperatus]SIO11778.1 two-component system, NtrC family, C4-dicarboxylate transport sensor histidine kinase DctB [Octadecabacter temperatus]